MVTVRLTKNSAVKSWNNAIRSERFQWFEGLNWPAHSDCRNNSTQNLLKSDPIVTQYFLETVFPVAVTELRLRHPSS